MTTSNACLFIWVVGGILCIGCNHPELAGLGMMIVAGCLRIAWGAEDRAR